jgi:hypothetical protein
MRFQPCLVILALHYAPPIFLLRLYLDTEESQELGEAFRAKRKPDPDKFGH